MNCGELLQVLRVLTHHTIGVGVTGLRHRQALDDFRGHPGKSAHHSHVSGVSEELGCTEITNLEFQQRKSEEKLRAG